MAFAGPSCFSALHLKPHQRKKERAISMCRRHSASVSATQIMSSTYMEQLRPRAVRT